MWPKQEMKFKVLITRRKAASIYHVGRYQEGWWCFLICKWESCEWESLNNQDKRKCSLMNCNLYHHLSRKGLCWLHDTVGIIKLSISNVKICKVIRLGSKNLPKSLLVTVTMKCQNELAWNMLQDSAIFQKVYLSLDLTLKERESKWIRSYM